MLLLIVLGYLVSTGSSQHQYDIIVYGATPGGIAAAIAAVVQDPSVGIVTPDPYIGGMVSAGGIGLRDIGSLSTVSNTSFAYQWAMINAKHYGVNYPVWQPDNYVGNATFWSILQSYSNSIDVVLDQSLVLAAGSVLKQGTTIISMATEDSAGATSWWNGTVFIDASYDGDLLVQSGCSWTFGRESQATYNETYAGVQPYTSFGQFLIDVDPYNPDGSLMRYVSPGPFAPVGSGDNHMMAYSYRPCITTNSENQAPFPMPVGYNRSDFAILQAFVEAYNTDEKQAPVFDYLVGAYPYRSYPPNNKQDLCDSNDSPVTSDAVGVNAPYITTNRTVRELVEQQVKYYVQGFVYYLANDPAVPEATQASVRAYGLCKDEWPENGHWPEQMYIREGVRLVGDVVVTQNDIVGGVCRNDSIGLGSWNDDIHVVQRVAIPNPSGAGYIVRNEGEMMAPYYGSGNFAMPYALLLPKRSEATNLLVPVQNSISHAAIGGVREEPEYMQLGTAAGIAAAMSLNQTPVQDIDLAQLQANIEKQGGLVQPVSPCPGT